MNMINRIKQSLWDILSCGLPRDSDIEPLRKIFLMNSIILLGTIFILVLSIVAMFQKYYLLAAVDILFMFFSFWLFGFLRKTKDIDTIGSIGAVVSCLFFFYLVSSGSGNGSTFVWAYTYPVMTIFILGIIKGSLFSFVLLGLSLMSFAFAGDVPFFHVYPTEMIIRFVPSYIAIYFFSVVIERVREITLGRLQKSKIELEQTVRDLKHVNIEKEAAIASLNSALDEVQTLQGILPI